MLHKVTPYLIFISLLCFGLNSAYSQNIINRKSNQLPFEVLKTNKDTIKIHEIIINDFEKGYPVPQLKRDLEDLTGVKVLGSIPFIKDMSDSSLNRIFKKNLNIKSLFKKS